MLNDRTQTTLDINRNYELYEKLVPKENFFRKLDEYVDFTFLYDHLEVNYSKDFGRPAKDLVMLFKYLIIKEIYNVSDVTVVERSGYDLAIKMFLGLDPYETEFINPSTLTKFRRNKIKSDELLNVLIQMTLDVAFEKKVLKSKTVYIDATHSNAKDNKKKAVDILKNKSKVIRRNAYKANESLKEKMPTKPKTKELNDHVDYCEALIQVLEENSPADAASERVLKLAELVEDIKFEKQIDNEEGAEVGYKSEDNSFYGYKTHAAINDDRLIVGATLTPGNCSDTKEMSKVIDTVVANGVAIENLVGDGAYSSYNNIMYAKEKGINLVSSLNTIITGSQNTDRDGFIFNKDSNGYICPNGEHSIRINRKNGKNEGDGEIFTFFFDVDKCKTCPLQSGCYKEGSKTKSKTYTVMNKEKKEHLVKMELPENVQLRKDRYKVEAKFGELKNTLNYQSARYSGISGMTIQAGVSIFTSNMKRIMKLEEEK